MVRFIPTCLALILINFFANAQTYNYYVVIGSFAVETNAARHVERAQKLSIPATYVFNPDHKLFYVFVRDTDNKGEAYVTLESMQDEGFSDAWVYKGLLDGTIAFKTTKTTPGLLVAKAEQEPTQETSQFDNLVSQKDVNVVSTNVPVKSVESVNASNAGDAVVVPTGKPFVFNIINSETRKAVKGQVHLLESERAQQYQGVEANEKLNIAAPKNKGGRWYLACYVVGFKPVKSSFLYNNPQKTPGVSVGPDSEVVVPLALERVRRGDYIEMDNVKFIANASLFTPESERELMELVAMMEENPNYKIKLHGHTNGEPQGEIIARGESTNFFAIEQTNVRAAASAKQLSTWRAEAVKEFLISKGINASRISTKGEGNKQPIFDPKGSHAAGNDRVEVEVTKS